MQQCVLAIIPARAGSKGLPGKCVAPLAGRALIEHTILHAKTAQHVSAICVTTDSTDAAAVVAVTRAALYASPSGPDDHHAFFGKDRRGLIQPADAAVDIDTALDLRIAAAVLESRGQTAQTPQASTLDPGPQTLASFLIA